MNDCIFCKVISGDTPSYKIYEDEKTFAFLDTMPTNKGHVLVIPKEHYKNIFDTPEDIMCALIKTSKKMASIVKQAVGADGINVYMNNETGAGQIVFHTHIHIIPRFEKDGLKLWGGTPYKEGEKEEIMKKILNGLN